MNVIPSCYHYIKPLMLYTTGIFPLPQNGYHVPWGPPLPKMSFPYSSVTVFCIWSAIKTCWWSRLSLFSYLLWFSFIFGLVPLPSAELPVSQTLDTFFSLSDVGYHLVFISCFVLCLFWDRSSETSPLSTLVGFLYSLICRTLFKLVQFHNQE